MSLRWWTATGGSFARLIPVQRPLVLERRSRRHLRRRRPRLAPGSRRHRRRRHRRRLERHLDVLRAGTGVRAILLFPGIGGRAILLFPGIGDLASLLFFVQGIPCDGILYSCRLW